MLSNKVQEALNTQIRHEFASAYVYLSMSSWFETQNLAGFAGWMRLQAQEELVHAMKIFDFVQDREGRVVLQPVDGPPVEFESPVAAFETALEHEKSISARINALYEVAIEERDYPTQVMLQWFIEEQVEEEKTVSDIVEQLKMVGKDSTAMLMLDKELGARSTAE